MGGGAPTLTAQMSGSKSTTDNGLKMVIEPKLIHQEPNDPPPVDPNKPAE